MWVVARFVQVFGETWIQESLPGGLIFFNAMVKLKFYYDFLSQPCRTLYIFMKKTEIPFEPKPVNLRQGTS